MARDSELIAVALNFDRMLEQVNAARWTEQTAGKIREVVGRPVLTVRGELVGKPALPSRLCLGAIAGVTATTAAPVCPKENPTSCAAAQPLPPSDPAVEKPENGAARAPSTSAPPADPKIGSESPAAMAPPPSGVSEIASWKDLGEGHPPRSSWRVTRSAKSMTEAPVDSLSRSAKSPGVFGGALRKGESSGEDWVSGEMANPAKRMRKMLEMLLVDMQQGLKYKADPAQKSTLTTNHTSFRQFVITVLPIDAFG